MADIAPRDEILVDLTEDAGAAVTAAAGPDVVVVAEDGDEAPLPKRAVLQDDGSIVLPLIYPVTLRFKRPSSDQVREESFDQLHFRRMTGADMRAIAAATAGAGSMVTLARSARIPEAKFSPIFDRMDAADIDDAFAVVSRFLGTGRKTGR